MIFPRLLFVLCVLRGVVGTSSKMDFLPLADVRTDPVTTPNECLSPHVHTFYGAAGSLRPSTSYEELRNACGNSGNVDDNKSLYWHPTIYKFDPQTGLYHTVPIYFASAYYVWRTGETTAFADGFQMIARQSNGGKARVKFDCSGPSECEREDCTFSSQQECPETECFPVNACHELEIKIVFPNCWDGVSLTSDDYMSHVAYTEGDWGDLPVDDRQHPAYEAECPSTHPVRIPEIQFYFRIMGYEGGYHVFSDGTSSVHADYFSGWDEGELQTVLDECENDSEAASSDAWCEDYFTFRDAPKIVGDEDIVGNLEPLQPDPPLDPQATIAPEAITAISELPTGECQGELLPADSALDWQMTENCTVLGRANPAARLVPGALLLSLWAVLQL